MAATKFILGMRDAYFDALYDVFARDERCVFITADNGAPSLDRFGDDFPDRYYTVGIAEQQMIGMAAGLAIEGRKVYTYAIAPFITLRCFEQNKLDVCAMKLPIVNIGVGAGYAYDIMGPTHHTAEDVSVMRALPDLVIYSPADETTARALVEHVHADPSPQYLRFDRAGLPVLYEGPEVDASAGLVEARRGDDVCIVATGVMVHQALAVAERLAAKGLRAGVLDVFRLKPVDRAALLAHLVRYPRVVTLEEHQLAGGLGSILAEVFVDEGVSLPTLRIGQEDRFVFEMGGRNEIWRTSGMDVDTVEQRVGEFVTA